MMRKCKTCLKIKYTYKHRRECADCYNQKMQPYRRKYNQSPQRKYQRYKHAAKKRKLPFCLSYAEFMLFWQHPCTYCGVHIDTIGLDRKNPLQGYILENITSCCITCNEMKFNYTYDFFIEHIIIILKHIGRL
jgi:5-methylcytosine-specific restriction endonuclease McrA